MPASSLSGQPLPFDLAPPTGANRIQLGNVFLSSSSPLLHQKHLVLYLEIWQRFCILLGQNLSLLNAARGFPLNIEKDTFFFLTVFINRLHFYFDMELMILFCTDYIKRLAICLDAVTILDKEQDDLEKLSVSLLF